MAAEQGDKDALEPWRLASSRQVLCCLPSSRAPRPALFVLAEITSYSVDLRQRGRERDGVATRDVFIQLGVSKGGEESNEWLQARDPIECSSAWGLIVVSFLGVYFFFCRDDFFFFSACIFFLSRCATTDRQLPRRNGVYTSQRPDRWIPCRDSRPLFYNEHELIQHLV